MQIIFTKVAQTGGRGSPDGLCTVSFGNSDETDLTWLAASCDSSRGNLPGQVIDVVVNGLGRDGVQASFANGVAEIAPSARVSFNSAVNQILR